MRIQALTIFPELFGSFLATSLVGRAIERRLLDVDVLDLREFTDDRHRSVDDEPYGGGGGMVMTAQPFFNAAKGLDDDRQARRILLSPQGRRLDEDKVRELADRPRLLLFCGRYEGIDERVRKEIIDEEISIGDYVLSGGELPAMVLIEAVSRQIPGVIGLADSVKNDSFRNGLLDYPHYTRPRCVSGLPVPEVLLGGNHADIATWRRREALRATVLKRPDLLASADLTSQERHDAIAWAKAQDVSLPPGLQPGK